MKKKVLSLLLAATCAMSLFTGCGAKYEAKLPTEAEEADIFVQKIDGLSEDFIKGMDISTVLVQEESGVKYYNEDGQEEDLFKILADSGVNYIRVRVWNDPYDEEGNGYGGGNNDAAKAAEIGKRAAKYGMKLLVDFHYSDFWADPAKQFAPKAWMGLSCDEKADLLYTYTVECLNTIIKAGADVGMVQIGNEINNGMSGEKSEANVMKLLTAGSKAVRDVAADKKQDIDIVVHYTGIDDFDGTMKKAQALLDYEIDYDIFGVSYYPFWHGTVDNMKNVLTTIQDTYSKETCIVETSYLYTGEDGDFSGNSINADMALAQYPATVQGQTSYMRDIMAAAHEVGSLGTFYWEGAWTPVGRNSFEENQAIWEKYGSGWASSFAGAYDPNDAGRYYGGSSWDNQAFFDFDGKELPSLDVYKYVNYGATCPLEVMAYSDVYLEIGINQPLVMPETVQAFYNDPTCTEGVAITWNEEDLAKIDTAVAGEYKVSGTTADGTELVADVKVCNVNLLANPSFEDADSSMWKVTYVTGDGYTGVQQKSSDAYSGECAYHFYDVSNQEFFVEQTLTGLAAGTYAVNAQLQGGDVGNATIYLYVKVGDQVYESSHVTLDGWVQWKRPTISDIAVDGTQEVSVGVYVKFEGGGWGTIDDFEFYCQQESE